MKRIMNRIIFKIFVLILLMILWISDRLLELYVFFCKIKMYNSARFIHRIDLKLNKVFNTIKRKARLHDERITNWYSKKRTAFYKWFSFLSSHIFLLVLWEQKLRRNFYESRNWICDLLGTVEHDYHIRYCTDHYAVCHDLETKWY